MSKERLYIFDTTLRDGAQTQGVDFSLEDKEKILYLIGEAIDGGAYSKLSIKNTAKSRKSVYYSDFLPILCNQDPFLLIFYKIKMLI